MFEPGYADDTEQIANETVFATLAGVANNPAIFSKLDKETQKKMISLLAAYAEQNVDLIYRAWSLRGLTGRAREIQNQLEENKPKGIL